MALSTQADTLPPSLVLKEVLTSDRVPSEDCFLLFVLFCFSKISFLNVASGEPRFPVFLQQSSWLWPGDLLEENISILCFAVIFIGSTTCDWTIFVLSDSLIREVTDVAAAFLESLDEQK